MQKRTVLIGVAVLALVGAGAYLMPDTGTQGFLVNKNFDVQQTTNKLQNTQLQKNDYQKDIIQREPVVFLKEDQSSAAQDPEPVEEEQNLLPDYQSITEDGVIYYSGDCVPGVSPNSTLVYDSNRQGGEYLEYSDFVDGLAAEVQSSGNHRLSATRCPYLIEGYGNDLNRGPVFRYICRRANASNNNNGISEVSCFTANAQGGEESRLLLSSSPRFDKPIFTLPEVSSDKYQMPFGITQELNNIVRLRVLRTSLDSDLGTLPPTL